MSTVIDVESVKGDAEPVSPVADDDPQLRWYQRLARAGQGQTNKIVVIAGLLLFAVIFFAPTMFITVHSGEVGVLYLRFAGGTQTDRVLGEGMKVIPPWDKLFVYNVRVQEVKHEMDVLTSEGLTVKIGLSIRYHPEIELVGLLHQQVGPSYRDMVVIPEVESAMRTIIGASTMREVYSMQRSMLQTVINDSLEHVSQKFVRIDEIVLREVVLPEKVRHEVEEKMAQKEIAESYEYRLEIARQEAARRQIEADGLNQYHNILNMSLTPNVLRWEGIEATKSLAQSPNAKTIIIGDKSGLPLILGDGSVATPGTPK